MVSPRYEFLYASQYDLKMKKFSHWLHWFGFSSVWVGIWLSRRIFHEKVYLKLRAVKWLFPSMSYHVHPRYYMSVYSTCMTFFSWKIKNINFFKYYCFYYVPLSLRININIISRSDRHQRRQTLTLTSCSFYVSWANGRPVVFWRSNDLGNSENGKYM